MERWSILCKSMILAYYVYGFISGSPWRPAQFMLCLLIYVALCMAFYIIRNALLRRCAAAFVLVAVAAASLLISPDFALLLPAALLDLFEGLHVNPVALCALSLLPLLPDKAHALQYLIADAFTLSITLLAARAYGRIARQGALLDEFREKNYELYRKLDRSRDFDEQMQYMSSLNERNKIAQELHDKIGHVISGSIIQLEAAQVLLKTDTEKAGGLVASVTGLLSHGMDDIRTTLKSIKPPPEMLGFNRVKTLAGEFERKTDIQVLPVCTGDLNRVTLAQWRILLDNIGESLTNALKYSHATKIRISIEVFGKVVKCEVKDNGRGAEHIVKGLGVAGMEERAQSAGGNVILDGSNGFSVITIMPAQ